MNEEIIERDNIGMDIVDTLKRSEDQNTVTVVSGIEPGGKELQKESKSPEGLLPESLSAQSSGSVPAPEAADLSETAEQTPEADKAAGLSETAEQTSEAVIAIDSALETTAQALESITARKAAAEAKAAGAAETAAKVTDSAVTPQEAGAGSAGSGHGNQPQKANEAADVMYPQKVPDSGNGSGNGKDGSGNGKDGDGNGKDGGGNGKDGGGDGKDRGGNHAFLISMVLVFLILCGMYAYGYNYCKSHFMPGTQINGYDCSRMTEEEVEEKFADAAKDYVLNIRFRGGATEILHAQEIGFAYKPDGSIAALLQEQDCLFWPKYFFEDYLYEIKPGGTYDDELLTKALQKLPELQEENMEKPKDAYIRFIDGDKEKDGRFEIVPETEGSTIDLVQLAAGVGDAAARYAEIVDAEEIGGAYVEAGMKADNAKIIARCNELNDLVGASITYVLPDGDTVRLNSDVMKDWLVKDDSGKLVRDEKVWDEKLWVFLDELASKANTIGMSRQFHSSLRGTITVSGGDYGYMVNQITEHDKVVEDIKKCKKDTRKPDYYISPYNEETENDGIGTTYIEVDLSAQHVWCYVNGRLVMDSDCVSGDMATDHSTPTGVFGIMFMLRDTTLRGVMQSNGKYEYETKVGYWMPFYNGCGFHDAWWRTAFGGTIYQTDGSHGCINLPVSAAETLYSYCEDKMPVVVYW